MKKNAPIGIGLLTFSLVVGCQADLVDCGPHGTYQTIEGGDYCLFDDRPEGGCPDATPHGVEVGRAYVCARDETRAEDLPPAICEAVGEPSCAGRDAGAGHDAGGERDAGEGADAGPATDAGADAGFDAGTDAGPSLLCSSGVTADTLLFLDFNGAPASWSDPAGMHPLTVTMGATNAPLSTCGDAMSLPYTSSGLGPGFGSDGVTVSTSGAPDSLSLDDHASLTIDAWVYPLEVDPSGGTSGPKPNVVWYAGHQYRLWVYDGRFVASTSSSCRAGDSGPPVVLNRWYHLTGIYEATGAVRLYVDGSLVEARTGCPVTSIRGDLHVGNTEGNDVFPGYIDEVRIRDGVHLP